MNYTFKIDKEAETKTKVIVDATIEELMEKVPKADMLHDFMYGHKVRLQSLFRKDINKGIEYYEAINIPMDIEENLKVTKGKTPEEILAQALAKGTITPEKLREMADNAS
jgi:hypothetical protein